MEQDFWDIIESNFGMHDVLDEEQVNPYPDILNQPFKIFPIAPGIMIMIKDDDFYG